MDLVGWAQLLTSIATLLTAISGFIVLLFKFKSLHGQLNGLQDKLIRSTAKESEAIGKEKGVQQERTRQDRPNSHM